jgi:hypothetical protein
MLIVSLAAHRRVLGGAHPDTLATAECLEAVRFELRHEKRVEKRHEKPERRTKKGESAALPPLPPPSQMAQMAEAEARAAAAEAELLAMLELEDASHKGPTAEGKPKQGKHKSKPKASKR